MNIFDASNTLGASGGASGGSAFDVPSLEGTGGTIVSTGRLGGQTTLTRPTIIAAGQAFPVAIAVDHSNLYWFNLGTFTVGDPLVGINPPWTQGQVLECALSGCGGAPTVLASGRVSKVNGGASIPAVAFFSDGASVYWNDETSATPNVAGNGDQLFACSVAGCGNNPRSIYPGVTGVDMLVVDGGNVYWTTGSPSVEFCPILGCITPSVFYSQPDPQALSLALALDGNDVYWSYYDGEILRCAQGRCGGVPISIQSGGQPVALEIVFDASNLYYLANDYAPSGYGEVLACSKSGCADNPIVLARTSSLSYLSGIATDGLNVYWTELGDAAGQTQGGAGVVRKCAVGGCNNLPTTVASDLTLPQAIVVDDQNVYWAEAGSNLSANGRIWKAPK